MYSGDSLSSPVTSDAAREGSIGEDAVGLSCTSALAQESLSYFQSCKFEECIDILNQLNEKKQNDPKVLHNMAIAEYFRDQCSNSKKLLEELNCVKKKSEDLASAAKKEQVEAANPRTNVSMSKDQFDSTLTTLNIAVTWFHLHQYAKSLSILEPLFRQIEPLDDTIALQICFLLLDTALACRDAVNFLAVFDYMDKAFGVGFGQEENGSAIQLSLNQVSKTSFRLSVASDTLKSDLTSAETESSLSEDTLDSEKVLVEIEAEKQMNPVGHSPANNLLKTLGERSIFTVDLKLELQLYKVRFLLLTRNLKLAKREVKHAMNIAQKRDSSMALLLKSQLEYAHGNHRKAIKLLMVSGIQKEVGTSTIFNNNLGCIYYQLGKYQASSVLFSKALSSCSSLRKEKPVKLFSLSQDKSLLITYNCGLLYLACGKPLLAAQCFQKASLGFGRQPLIWLRIAECCMMAFQKGLLEEGNTDLDRSEIKVHVIGKGKWRHLMLEENGMELADSSQWPKLSLPLARVCLLNGLYLLNVSLLNDSKTNLESTQSLELNETKEASASDHREANTNSDLKEAKGVINQDMIQNSLSAFKDIRSRENQLMGQAVLASMAYVELELENPIKALSAANSLLQLSDCSKIYVFLGHLYAAEALCLLNRPIDAVVHLSVYLLGQDDFKLPFTLEDFDQWRVNISSDCEETSDTSTGNARDTVFLKPEEARGALFADLAALLATQGRHDQAKLLITHSLTLLPNNVQATVTAVYIDLMLGRSQDALTRLKQCTRVSFVPGRLEVRDT